MTKAKQGVVKGIVIFLDRTITSRRDLYTPKGAKGHVMIMRIFTTINAHSSQGRSTMLFYNSSKLYIKINVECRIYAFKICNVT